MKNYILARLKEPTTWSGLVMLATAAGAHVSPEMASAIVQGGIALAGAIHAGTPSK